MVGTIVLCHAHIKEPSISNFWKVASWHTSELRHNSFDAATTAKVWDVFLRWTRRHVWNQVASSELLKARTNERNSLWDKATGNCGNVMLCSDKGVLGNGGAKDV